MRVKCLAKNSTLLIKKTKDNTSINVLMNIVDLLSASAFVTRITKLLEMLVPSFRFEKECRSKLDCLIYGMIFLCFIVFCFFFCFVLFFVFVSVLFFVLFCFFSVLLFYYIIQTNN